MIKRRCFDKAAWRLMRERFQITSETPPADDSFISIQDVLVGIFKKIETSRQPWLFELDEEWDALMGDLVAGHARPAGIRQDTLIVHVDSSAWLSELVRFRRKEMLARLQKKFGAARIRNVSLKLAAGSAG